MMSSFILLILLSLLFLRSIFFTFIFPDILNYNDIMFPTDSTGSTYFPPIFRPKGIMLFRLCLFCSKSIYNLLNTIKANKKQGKLFTEKATFDIDCLLMLSVILYVFLQILLLLSPFTHTIF